MANEVRIKLTGEQKAKIKEGTGKEMDEIRIGRLGNNPAVTPTPSPRAPSPRAPSPRAPSPRAPSPRAPSPRAPSPRAPSPRAPSV